MRLELSALERLDLVARSKPTLRLISTARVFLLVFTPFLLLLFVESEAPQRETAAVGIVVAASLLTAVVLWLNWRYKLFVLSLLCFLFVVADILSNDPPRHTILGWTGAHVLSLAFVYWGCELWIIAKRYARANNSDYRKEREQVDNWQKVLEGPIGPDVIEFPTGSFWTGYWTYRMLRSGDYWLIGQYKKGTHKLRGLRVHKSDAIALTRLPSGKGEVEITDKGRKKTFTEVGISVWHPASLWHTRKTSM